MVLQFRYFESIDHLISKNCLSVLFLCWYLELDKHSESHCALLFSSKGFYLKKRLESILGKSKKENMAKAEKVYS